MIIKYYLYKRKVFKLNKDVISIAFFAKQSTYRKIFTKYN